MSIVKNRLGIVAGAISAMIVIGIGEVVIDKNFPHPPMDMNNKAAVAEMISYQPLHSFIALLANYAFASFVGGIFATLVSGRQTNNPAFVTGLLLMLAGIANLIMIRQPLWFAIASSLVYIPCSILGFVVVRKK
jgi:hypothetical protein